MHGTTIALAAAGAVAATALAAAALTNSDPSPRETGTSTSSPSPPAVPPSPSATFPAATRQDWLTSVPDDLSVALGLPPDGGDFTRVSEAVTWTFCDAEAFPEGASLDTRRAGATGPEYADRRDLRVFPDDRTAHAFLSHAVSAAGRCPEEQHGGTRWIHTVSTGALGEDSARILQTYETDGLPSPGATWWDVTRVGNAVLVTATGGEYVAGETLGAGIRSHQRLLSPIVDQMCVFHPDGCPAVESRGAAVEN